MIFASKTDYRIHLPLRTISLISAVLGRQLNSQRTFSLLCGKLVLTESASHPSTAKKTIKISRGAYTIGSTRGESSGGIVVDYEI